jgi:hypothetical protein
MNTSKSELLAAEKNGKTGEGQSSASAAIEAPTSQKTEAAATAADLTSDSIMPLIQKIAAGSIAEIERTIGELQATRSFLESEVERIHQEAIRFAQLNKTATASVKIISESISEWLEAGRQGRSTVTGPDLRPGGQPVRGAPAQPRRPDPSGSRIAV